MECDLILAGGVVVDGTGTRGYPADVGLRHGQLRPSAPWRRLGPPSAST